MQTVDIKPALHVKVFHDETYLFNLSGRVMHGYSVFKKTKNKNIIKKKCLNLMSPLLTYFYYTVVFEYFVWD